MESKQCKLLFSDCCRGNNTGGATVGNVITNENVYSEEVSYGEEKNYAPENIERPIINVQGDQPVFNIPVYQDKYIRDKIIESPKYEIQDVVQPKYYSQETKHDVPTVELLYKERKVNIPQEKILETPVEIDMPIGYTPIFSPVWDVREIPRVIPKYEGEQKVIEVEVPQIKYIDKFIEKEIVVDIKEKIIPKITEVEKQVDIVKYQWKEKYQDVPVCKYVPKIDVELDCPPPLIVPYPEVHFQNTSEVINPNQRAADIPPEFLLKNSNMYNNMSNVHVDQSVQKSLLEVARLISSKDKLEKEQQNKRKKKRMNNNWPFCSFKKCNNEEEKNDMQDIDPQTGYPISMPKDFAAFFKKDLNTVKKQMGQHSTDTKSTISSNFMEKSPVNPTIEYLGKIDKPPIDGGKLDSISFKLHAIEVHQFIPVPNLPKPKFLDLVPPEKFENNDISSLQNVFGPPSEDWVDPNITGYIAPMMHDVLHGNVQPQSPLFNKLSIGNNDRVRTLSSMHDTRRNYSGEEYTWTDHVGGNYNADSGYKGVNRYDSYNGDSGVKEGNGENGGNYEGYGEGSYSSKNCLINHKSYSSFNHLSENQESYN
ncbi:inner membrane complex protein 1j, putative [Plasmodium ovale]|uniref:Inner membrane complex protein 1j, putative n=2 Tax=Plasmodium ovale TaxID=36330 RepID=A0A1A8WSP4_PLAOA|nr:inner membrane complex protein 1j, putative [Plasmodium ovale curtisi]SBS94359.1 inner membrane complex protein 1j, putative [Plasmodium ovale curtisi]SCP05056.1 inner membrane complex protein 1j, putative [Plasmodium ovale]